MTDFSSRCLNSPLTDIANHAVKFSRYFGLEVRFDLINLGELCECPSALSTKMIYAGHPIRVHRGFLFFRVFAPVAFDLDN